VPAGRLDRRKFLEAGMAALDGGVVAWRLWPWRRPSPTTPARAALEGYGLVRVDEAGRQLVIECWPWDGGPQFAGWPYRLPFPEVGGLEPSPPEG
jgi:hypothetical protein